MPSRVSVVIPTYQRASLLAETLEMIRAQTLKPFEIIVCDDGSTDATDAVVAADPSVVYIKSQRRGMPGNLNAGLERARGEYVMVCHDHDIYMPDMLEKLAAALDRNPTALFAHCGLETVDPDGRFSTARFVRPYPERCEGRRFLVDEMLPGLHSPVPALAMIRRSAAEGRWLDPAVPGCSDVEFWMRLCLKGDVAYVPDMLIRVRERDASSAFYEGACRLAGTVLAAKTSYLRAVDDPARRAAIQRGWRREIDRTALLHVLNDLRRGTQAGFEEARDLVTRHGTKRGALAVRLILHGPRTVSRGVLLGVRTAWRAVRFFSADNRRLRATAARAGLSR